MKKIAIIPNLTKDSMLQNTITVAKLLKKLSIEVIMSDDIDQKMDGVKYVSRSKLLDDVDMLITLGGDGTLLTVAKECAYHDVPILGLNLGYLGFLSELEKQDLNALSDILKGRYKIEQRMMLKTKISGKREELVSLNDTVISRGDSSKMLHLNVFVDNQLLSNYLADGLIVSTPTGSTAYSLSAGGPIVEPNMELIILTPICPHSLHSRSIIIPATKKVRILINPSHSHHAVVSADGQSSIAISQKDEIIIKKTNKKVKLIRTLSRSFFDTLRIKLEG